MRGWNSGRMNPQPVESQQRVSAIDALLVHLYTAQTLHFAPPHPLPIILNTTKYKKYAAKVPKTVQNSSKALASDTLAGREGGTHLRQKPAPRTARTTPRSVALFSFADVFRCVIRQKTPKFLHNAAQKAPERCSCWR